MKLFLQMLLVVCLKSLLVYYTCVHLCVQICMLPYTVNELYDSDYFYSVHVPVQFSLCVPQVASIAIPLLNLLFIEKTYVILSVVMASSMHMYICMLQL